jgi:hypothetical protein
LQKFIFPETFSVCGDKDVTNKRVWFVFKDHIKDALAGVDSGYSKEAGSSSQYIDSFIY